MMGCATTGKIVMDIILRIRCLAFTFLQRPSSISLFISSVNFIAIGQSLTSL